MTRMRVDPGRLRHEVALEEPVTAPDGAGGYSESWVETARFFAAIEPLQARSLFGADRRLETESHRILLRHRPDVRPGMRFFWRGRALMIRTVRDPDGSARYLSCETMEDPQ